MALRRAPRCPSAPLGISVKINGVAAVWEGCQRGSFDSAQTPFGINWQSGVEGSPAFEEEVSAKLHVHAAVSEAWERSNCQHARVFHRSVCVIGLGGGVHPLVNQRLPNSS